MKEKTAEKRPAFIADCHLGKLAKYLRMMGFDTLFFEQIEDSELIRLARKENRIILTRDKELSQRKGALTYLLKDVQMPAQLKDVAATFKLKTYRKKFSRCIVCNRPLRVVEKEHILNRLPPKVIRFFDYFEICDRCDRVYWHGDHYKRMQAALEEILSGI